MKKKTSLLTVLTAIVVIACGIADIPFLAQPTATLPPTSTSAPPTATASPQVLPTRTQTPTPGTLSTQIAPTFPPAATATPAPSATATAIPASLTPTAAIGLSGTGFNAINQSSSVFYWGACEPTTVTLTVNVTNAAQITDVVLFTRIGDKTTGGSTAWGKGVSMANVGPGVYSRTLNSEHMGITEDSWIQYQLVGTDQRDQIVARSPVFHDTLSLSPCP